MGRGTSIGSGRRGLALSVLRATPEEEFAHEAMLVVMAKKAPPIWRELEAVDLPDAVVAEPAAAA